MVDRTSSLPGPVPAILTPPPSLGNLLERSLIRKNEFRIYGIEVAGLTRVCDYGGDIGKR
jgi:hypothetical protein